MNQNARVTAASPASGTRRVEGEGERGGRAGGRGREEGEKPGLQQQRLDRDVHQPGRARSKGFETA